MKTKIITLVAVLITVSITAQVPQKMSYQAIIRNDKDSLVINQPVGLLISILQGSVNGTEIYKEFYDPKPVTNMNGLITVEIGMGTPVTGTFSSIDWAVSSYFIKTETDPTGNNNYSITNTSQLLSVPYALHAKTAEVLVGDSATRSYINELMVRIEAIEKHLYISPDSVFTDARDGTQYKMVKIGDQTWMAENLKYLPAVTRPDTWSNAESHYYVNEFDGTNVNEAKATVNYQTYGVLYNWPAAMDGSSESTSNPSGVQGVCPASWHLPSRAEWEQLIDYLGGESVAGSKLKETGTTHWRSPNTGATNESGFTTLPGGSFTWYGSWFLAGVGWDSYFWSTSRKWDRPEHVSINSSENNVYFGQFDVDIEYYQGQGFSVRCVKD